jgi:hypothetical protein
MKNEIKTMAILAILTLASLSIINTIKVDKLDETGAFKRRLNLMSYEEFRRLQDYYAK